MPLHGVLKRLGGSVRSHLGVLDRATEEKMQIAEELACQATEQYTAYNATNNVDCLYKAVALSQQAVDTIDEEHTMHTFERNYFVSELVHDIFRDQCLSLRGLFYETDDIKYLNECIGTLQLLYAYAPKTSRQYVLEACLLSRTLFDRYFAHDQKDEDEHTNAVAIAQSVLLSVFKGKNKKHLSNPDGDFLRVIIDDTQKLIETPLEITKAIYLYSRGGCSIRRYHRQRDIGAITAARSYLTGALQLLPSTHEKYAKAAVDLADCEVLYIDQTSDISGLESALQLIDSLDLSKFSSDEFVSATVTKSTLLRCRFDRLSNPEDLNLAIEAAQQSTESTTAKVNLRLVALDNLSTQLGRRSNLRVSLSDSEAAIQASHKALQLCPAGALHERSRIYATLGLRLIDKYADFGDLQDLKSSIQPLRDAVSVLPRNHGMRSMKLHNLANGLRALFSSAGALDPLEESIRVEREALSAVSDGDSHKYVILDGLALSLNQRFRRLRHSEDLNEAITAAEAALAGTPKGSTRYPRRLQSLAASLNDRFMQQKHMKDIDRAIDLVSEAIKSSEYDGSNKIIYSKTLSSCLEERYKACGDVSDLNQAIQLARDALVTAPSSNPLRPRMMLELGVLLISKFKITTNMEEKKSYLSEALVLQEDSVNMLPENAADLAWFLCTLGNHRVTQNDLLRPDEHDKRKSIFMSAISAYERGFDQKYATPQSRIRNGMLAGSCYMLLRNWDSASKYLSGSIQMFQQVSPLALNEDDRQGGLRGLSGISTDACISYLMLGMPETGAEVLEAGRGIMANIAMKQHDSLPILKDICPDLHSQYVTLRHSLSLPLPTEKHPGQDPVAKRHQDQLKFEEIEESIRRLPGLGNFNKSMSAQQIRQLAHRGPLVSFCVDSNRAFALIVSKDAIESIPLPDLKPAELEEMIPLVIGDTRLSLWRPSLRAKANTKMRKLLAWLWDSAIKPVLSHLKLLQDQERPSLPRLWWVTSGTLGLMPLHAAGKGSKFPMENTYAHVVSSYASTFSALNFARERQTKVFEEPSAMPNVTLVTMPQTPARTPLATEIEAQAIREAFASQAEDRSGLFELCQPTADAVLDRVRGSNLDIFHYSGHAETDLTDPSKTALLFGSDPTATAPDPLPIDKLRKYDGTSKLSSQAPQLAYLSACCTAQQNELKLLDENIHLAAIFQAMGFPAVIGTLWEADDKAAAFIAKVFYQKLIELSFANQGDAEPVPREEHIARALHAATAACRGTKFGKADGAKDVLLWANFVYFGA